MAVIIFDPVKFRSMIPEFSDATKWPDELLALYWNQAICVAEDEGDDCTEMQLYLLMGHLLKIHINTLLKNKQGGFVSSSSIDKVSVTKVAPPSSDMFEWWLGQTPYGQQLLVMLQVAGVGGLYVGGLPERTAFRKVGGVY
jgi:hypothetical protein